MNSISRLAVAQFRMRRFYDRNTPVPADDQPEEVTESQSNLAVANVHLHYALANQNSNLTSKDAELRRFYDALADAIIAFRVRLVNGDFNMDAIRTVTELNARGFCANVVS